LELPLTRVSARNGLRRSKGLNVSVAFITMGLA